MTEPIAYARTDAAQVAALSVSTMEKLVRERKFPAPRKASDGRTVWLRREIVEWAEALPVSDLLPPPNTSRRSCGRRS